MATKHIQTIGGEKRKVKKGVPMYVWISIVIVVVVGGVMAAVMIPPHKRLQKAEHDVDQLVLALNGFAKENGRYPKGTLAEIAALLRGEDVRGQNPKRLDYIESTTGELNAAGEFIDPWGTPYHINIDGAPRVYSCGPDRADEYGGGDDISSWRDSK